MHIFHEEDLFLVGQRGFIVRTFDGYESAVDYMAGFGETFFKTEIKVDETVAASLSSNEPMGLHNDHPGARFIAWYCKSQSDLGGVSLLQDYRILEEHLAKDEVDELKRIAVAVPSVSSKTRYLLPMLNQEGIYYAQWLVSEASRNLNLKGLSKFEKLMSEIKPIEVRLEEQQVLLIDNKRMLHGRSGFSEHNKKRLLIRHWIA